jgi:type I restriction enzyme S subunit
LDREIPIKWETGTIQDLGEVVAGGTPSTKNTDYYCDKGIAWITPNDLSNLKGKYISHGERDITELGLKESSAQLMPKGSVLISTRAPIGYIAIALNDVSTNQGFKTIVPKSEYGSEYVYYTIKSNITAIEHLGSGTTFMEVSKDSISKFKLVFPENKIVSLFNEKIKSASAKMIEVQLENQKLEILRDWLMPMLMNGQVTFKE